MALQQEIKSFAQRQFPGADFFPSLSDAFMSFGVMSVESFSSMHDPRLRLVISCQSQFLIKEARPCNGDDWPPRSP